jgi:hypothetical protein
MLAHDHSPGAAQIFEEGPVKPTPWPAQLPKRLNCVIISLAWAAPLYGLDAARAGESENGL